MMSWYKYLQFMVVHVRIKTKVYTFCKLTNTVMVLFIFFQHEKESSDEGSMFHTLRKKSGNLGFLHAFLASLSVILVSEIGDKTFFIAAIMAMRHSRTIVFAGAISSLWLMTILSGMFICSYWAPSQGISLRAGQDSKTLIHAHKPP